MYIMYTSGMRRMAVYELAGPRVAGRKASR